MDNVTHTLLGAALARAGLNRVTPHATLLLVLSANIPDIDMLSLAGGPLAALEVHRGYTHTFLALPLLALICVGLTFIRRSDQLRLFRAWPVALVGAASHLLLDWTNSYGIRPWLPFSSRWYYLDLNGLYDAVIFALLGSALLWPWFVNLVQSEMGKARRHTGQSGAIAILLALLMFEGFRWGLHGRALNQLSSRLYDGEIPVNISALPEPNNPFHWTGIVETGRAFRIVPVNALILSDVSDARIFLKSGHRLSNRDILAIEPFRYMAYFARFPVWSTEPAAISSGLGKRVDLSDLRFGMPEEGRFHAIALEDAAGTVTASSFAFTAGSQSTSR